MDEEEALNLHASLVTPEHFIRVFEFVDRHQWIYNFQLTKFFSEEVWRQAPEEWLSFLTSMTADELKELPFKAQWNGCPDSLQHFLETCLKLSLPRNQMKSLEPTKLNPRLTQGLTAKKQHEVTYMSSFIHRLATVDNIQHIVDIGCGLGYLDHVLAHVYEYQILGIECSEAFAHKAEVRGSNLGCLINNKRSGHLSTCALELKESAESEQQFESAVTSHLTPTQQPLMMIGLHCCGDLTPTMLKFFLQLETVRTLICVSCCYHKMDYDDDQQRFTNFPLSQAARNALDLTSSGSGSQTQLNIYAMRLAAQETRSRWFQQSAEEQNFHTKNVAFRGLLEILFKKHNIKPPKHGCRVTKKSDFSTAESYIEAVLLKMQITSDSQWQKLRTEFLNLCKEKKEYFDFIEPITSLQVLLQPVLESLIHLDRLAFLQEQGTKASLVPIFDEYISPRNFVLVAQK